MSQPTRSDFAETKFLIRSDLYRYEGRSGIRETLKNLLYNEGFQFSFWWRLASYTRRHRFAKLTIHALVLLIYRHYRHVLGIQIAPGTQIGSGFYIGHFSCIVVSPHAVIGKNCNISQGVTIGAKNGRCPVIGDNVYVGPGAKIFGGITIGSNVEIGANAVVTHDVPDNTVVAGVPARPIGTIERLRAVNHIDYECGK